VPDERLDDDLKAVRDALVALAQAGKVDELIAVVLRLLLDARTNNSALAAQLGVALRQIYGRKSEKVSVDQLLLLFGKLGDEVPAALAADTKSAADQGDIPKPPPAAPARVRKGRNPLPAHLPREEKIIPVAPGLRTCAKCGADKRCFGRDSSELLDFVPAHFIVIVEKREKLVCDTCDGEIVAAESDRLIAKARPGAGLLAHLLISKYQDSLPIYRQSAIYARSGVDLAPSTLGEWVGYATTILAPIAKMIALTVLGSHVVGADDTGLPVLDRDDPRGIKRGHLFAYVGDMDLVAFDYTPDWSADGPAEFLAGYQGFLQCDGYKGFVAKLKDSDREQVVPDLRRLGCGMHIRRKFEAAKDLGDARGAIALGYFRKIYDVERACKTLGLDHYARKQHRDEHALAVVDDLFAWIAKLKFTVVPGTPIAKAVTYALNQELAFRRCYQDGRFEIDNGEVERQLRRVALGRKNFLFAGSDEGAERAAIAYSVLGSCHMQGIDPLAYLADVMTRLQNGWPMARADELRPDVWKRMRDGAADAAAE
jgi:transposase